MVRRIDVLVQEVRKTKPAQSFRIFQKKECDRNVDNGRCTMSHIYH